MFYYNLSAVSPQDIRCDIYTGRIKPVISEGLDKYQQIRDYLSKAVAAHQEANRLDSLSLYGGRFLFKFADSLAGGTTNFEGTIAGSL